MVYVYLQHSKVVGQFQVAITHPLDFFKLSPELHVAMLFCNTPKVAVAMTISSNTPRHHFLQLLGSQMEELQVTTCT